MAQIDDAELGRLRAIETTTRWIIERSRVRDSLIVLVPRAEFENAPSRDEDMPGYATELGRLLGLPPREYPPLPADRKTSYAWDPAPAEPHDHEPA